MTAEETAEAPREVKSPSRRPGGSGKKRGGGRPEANAVSRFFLGKADGKSPVLEREVGSENEAMIESLKTGQSYFVVSEWRALADLSGKSPQVGKELVKREERDRTAAGGLRALAPAQAS
jgi:hypothetical protein